MESFIIVSQSARNAHFVVLCHSTNLQTSLDKLHPKSKLNCGTSILFNVSTECFIRIYDCFIRVSLSYALKNNL